MFCGAFVIQMIFRKNQCADCSFIGIYRTRVRAFRFVLLFFPCNAGSCVFSGYCLIRPEACPRAVFVQKESSCLAGYPCFSAVCSRSGCRACRENNNHRQNNCRRIIRIRHVFIPRLCRRLCCRLCRRRRRRFFFRCI